MPLQEDYNQEEKELNFFKLKPTAKLTEKYVTNIYILRHHRKISRVWRLI